MAKYIKLSEMTDEALETEIAELKAALSITETRTGYRRLNNLLNESIKRSEAKLLDCYRQLRQVD